MFKVGDLIEWYHNNTTTWQPGVIETINSDGTYRILLVKEYPIPSWEIDHVIRALIEIRAIEAPGSEG